jgi:HD superfamily phosphodiesterase
VSSILEHIKQLAEPYLNTRANDIHTRISLRFAYELLRSEGGDEGIVLPAVILHDVGWKRVPEDLQLQAFGPKARNLDLRRVHEVEGAAIAAEILREASCGEAEIGEITEIIRGHDSRETAVSLNDRIVKDADKLWRYSREGFRIDVERFGMTHEEEVQRLRSELERWFFTQTAKEIARRELAERVKEA